VGQLIIKIIIMKIVVSIDKLMLKVTFSRINKTKAHRKHL